MTAEAGFSKDHKAVRSGWLCTALFGSMALMQVLVLIFLGKIALAAAVAAVLAVPVCYAAGGMGRLRSTVSLRLVGICFGLSLAIFAIGGEGRFFYANTDWQVRNAVLLDLVRHPWPWAYQTGDQLQVLRAPLGMYLVPALAGKLAGFRAAELALLLQNAGLLAVLLALAASLYQTVRQRFIALGVFFGFSGMDVIGQFLVGKSLSLHLEQWAGLQYTAHLTQAFWVPQHAMAGWIFAVLYLLWRDGKAAAWIPLAAVPLIGGFSPLAMIGCLPFAALIGYDLVRNRALGRADLLFPGLATIGFLPVLAYLAAGSSAVGASPAYPTVVLYLVFIGLEVGVALLALALVARDLRFGVATLVVVALVLLLAPFGRIGEAVDFVMRVSIPALAILALIAADLVMGEPSASASAGQTIRWKWARLTVLGALLVGLVTPLGELSRSVVLPAAPRQLCGYFGVVPGGYATYTTSLGALPSLVRPGAPMMIPVDEPTACWDGPWPDTATGAGMVSAGFR
jgi:hypothetical protein